jgi:hypothetical protein
LVRCAAADVLLAPAPEVALEAAPVVVLEGTVPWLFDPPVDVGATAELDELIAPMSVGYDEVTLLSNVLFAELGGGESM